MIMDRLTRVRRRDDSGATAVEYGLIVALIAVVIIVAVVLLGRNLSTTFSRVASTVVVMVPVSIAEIVDAG